MTTKRSALLSALLIGLPTLGAPALAQAPKDAAPAAAAREAAPAPYTVAPAPSWVIEQQPAPPRPKDADRIEGGAYYALIDTQRRLDPDGAGTHSFRRTAVTVTGRAGLEEVGRFVTGVDPTDSTLIVHHVRILREGEPPRDVLPRMTLQAARQEERLDQGVTDGFLTVFGDVPGLRVGDTLDVATSLIERNPHWPGEVAGRASMRWSVPSGRNHHRVLVPTGRALTLVPYGDSPAPTRSEADGMTAYTWEAVHAEPRRFVSDVPIDVPVFASTAYASWSDWNAVARWGAALYEQDLTLPDELAERVAMLRRRPRAERITAAIRIAQDEVRYMSDAVGLGAYVPRTPAVTWANGYGDCKDKSLLLVALLRAMGVKADVALANTEAGHALRTYAPTPTAFDHVIVRIGGQRRPSYVDATWSLQGGVFPDITQPDHGYVLPLTRRGALTRIEIGVPDAPQTAVSEVFDFADADGEGVTMTVETVRTRGHADGFRATAEASSVVKLSEQYLSFYRQYYPGLALAAPMTIEDDREANRSVVTERYRLAPSETDALREGFPVVPSGVMVGLPEVLDPERALPLALPYPVRARHEVRFLNQAVPFEAAGPVAATAGPLAVRVTQEADGNDMRVTYTVEATGDRLEPSDLDAYRALYETWDDQTNTVWTLPRDNFSELKEAFGG